MWRVGASELAGLIRRREVSARDAATSVLARIAEVNPRINALPEVLAEQALDSAVACDRALAAGFAPGPLHGVTVTIKVNVDSAGHATTDGIGAAKDNIARSDSPVVAHLRAAGAVIVGRNNTPAFSQRWFTENDLHGRTLNPFDAKVTPGGSSGGAAAAVTTGMRPIAHGNDYGGSNRYPAWACGVVGLRTTVGRVPSYKASTPNLVPTNQMMSVQGPLTRNVADAHLALQVMAQGSPLDPHWAPVPLEFADGGRPTRVAMIKRHAAFDADPTVVAAVDVSVQAQVLELFHQVRREFGLSMVFITHDLRVAAQMCDHIAVMRRGEIVEMGSASQVLADPRHAYTRELIAAAPHFHSSLESSIAA